MPRRTRSTKRRPPRAVIILRNPQTGEPTGQQLTATGGSRKKAIARVKALAHKMGVMILNPKGRNPGLAATIRAGDRVTIVNRFGQQSSGRAVMPSPGGGWVLNMGGRHGTPGIATDANIVRVKHSGKGPKYYPGLGPSRNPRRSPGARPHCSRPNPVYRTKAEADAAAKRILLDVARSGEQAIATVKPRRDPGGVTVYEMQWEYRKDVPRKGNPRRRRNGSPEQSELYAWATRDVYAHQRLSIRGPENWRRFVKKAASDYNRHFGYGRSIFKAADINEVARRLNER
jgi:hypothetical protein